jgi:hypothetical protein
MDRIRVRNADPTFHKYQTTAAISFDGKDYDNNLVDHRSLHRVMQAVIAAGYECETTWSHGIDRCTSVNYELILSDSSTTTASVEFARRTLEHIIGRSDKHSVDTRVDVIRGRSMRGSCTGPEPSRCRSLIEGSPYTLAEGTLHITQPRCIRPTYFSTMALYIADHSQRRLEDWAKEVNNVVFEYNREKGAKSFVTKVRISDTGKFLLFDPNEALLAQRFSEHAMHHGFFPRPLYEVNSNGGNFVRADIVAHRDRVLASKSAMVQRASVRTNIPAVEDMNLEQLQDRAQTIQHAIGALPTAHRVDCNPYRARENLKAELHLVQLRIENAKAKISAPDLPPPHVVPKFITHKYGTYVDATRSPGQPPALRPDPKLKFTAAPPGTYRKARGSLASLPVGSVWTPRVPGTFSAPKGSPYH